MRKNYFIGLSFLILAGCSTNDDLQNFDKQNNLNKSASGGFRGGDDGFGGGGKPFDDDDIPSNGIWRQSTIPPNPIYGFFSNHMSKHIYSPYSRADMLPRTQPGQYFYYLDRFLGSANGNGQEITGWFNEITEDYVLTTNPDEFNGQNGWRKNNNIGKSFNDGEEGSFPIYRYFRNKTKSHFYTRDFNELGNGKLGFVYEGVAFYLKDSAPEKYRMRDGEFYQDNNTGQYYITFESKLRLIENVETVRRLFDFRKETSDRIDRGWKNRHINKVNIDDYMGPRGKNLNQNTKLIRDTSNGKVYLLDDGLLRYIPNPEIFKLYYFREDSVINSSSLRGFVGKDITKTY